MLRADPQAAAAYMEAWKAWTKQLEGLHAVLIDGAPIGPAQAKGLLNREARAKAAYDAARERLLGISDTAGSPPADGSNPFR